MDSHMESAWHWLCKSLFLLNFILVGRMKRQYSRSLPYIAFSVLLLATSVSTSLFAAEVEPAEIGAIGTYRPSEQTLLREISGGRQSMEELSLMRGLAKSLQLRVWLLGGASATLAHYSKWNLAHKTGIEVPLRRYNYSFEDVFSSLQDLDLVVEGDEKNIEIFKSAVKTKYPHIQGIEDSFHVWHLADGNTDMPKLQFDGNKSGDISEFRKQHTDSHSIGMVEITDPKDHEPVVRDLFDWNAHRYGRENPFLKDVINNEIHFYFSNEHESVPIVKMGMNPPFIAATRLIIKAAQFGLKISEHDLNLLKSIITQYKFPMSPKYPWRVDGNSYAVQWTSRNAQKLYQNALDVGYAHKLAYSAGIMEKLDQVYSARLLGGLIPQKQISKAELEEDSNKKSAKELGIDMTYFKPLQPDEYERLVRSLPSLPNILLTGEPFLTRVGPDRNVAATIWLKVNPKAREGIDFTIHRRTSKVGEPLQEGDEIEWHNRSALRVLPKSLNLTPERFFRFLSEGRFDRIDQFSYSLSKLKRQLKKHASELDSAEQNRLQELVSHLLDTAKSEEVVSALVFEYETIYGEATHEFIGNYIMKNIKHLLATNPRDTVTHWLSLSDSAKHPEILQAIRENFPPQDATMADSFLAANAYSYAHWFRLPVVQDVLKSVKPRERNYVPEISMLAFNFERFMKSDPSQAELDQYLTFFLNASPEANLYGDMAHKVLIEDRVANSPLGGELFLKVLSLPYGGEMDFLVNALGTSSLKSRFWATNPKAEQILEAFLNRPIRAQEFPVKIHALFNNVFSRREWVQRPSAMNALKRVFETYKDGHIDTARGVFFLRHQIVTNMMIADALAETPGGLNLLKDYLAVTPDAWHDPAVLTLFSSAKWRNAFVLNEGAALDLTDFFIRDGLKKWPYEKINEYLPWIFKSSFWVDNPIGQKMLDKIVSDHDLNWMVARYGLSQDSWAEHPGSGRVLLRLIENQRADGDIVWHVLTKDAWINRPDSKDFIARLMSIGKVDHEIQAHLLTNPKWQVKLKKELNLQQSHCAHTLGNL